MKKLFVISTRYRLSAALLLAGSFNTFSIAARAADTPPAASAPAADKPAGNGEIKAMDEFLDKHSVIDDELRQHPALADNPDFLKSHPEYATFVAEHPGIASQLKDHPRYFVHRAMAAQRKQPITPGELKTLDSFLDNHPDVEKDLTANPKLIDDPKYIKAHADLHKFLNQHPKVDGTLESKPAKTMKREEALDKREQKKAAK